MLVLFGERRCRTPEEFKAWSQNLGHESTLTTFNSYGAIASHRQGELMEALKDSDKEEDKLNQILQLMNEQKQSSDGFHKLELVQIIGLLEQIT